MTGEPGPYDLDGTRIVYTPMGDAVPRPVTADFYAALDADFEGFAGHMLVSQHRFETDWGSWEMHPAGDEFVFLIDGAVDFVLWIEGEERMVRVTDAGTYVVVPKGTWHTARPRRLTTMLFLTPGAGTEIAQAPIDDATG